MKKLFLVLLAIAVFAGSAYGSENTIWSELQNGHCKSTGSAIYLPALGGRLLNWGTTVPSNGATGYPIASIFVDMDAASGATSVWVNTGTSTSCTFVALNLGTGSFEDIDAITYTPTDTEPTATEGASYFDHSETTLKIYDGGNWIPLSAGTNANTLDLSYDQGGVGVGRFINATDGAVIISSTDADNAFMLGVNPTPSGAAASGGISITVGANSTQDAIQINNAGTGDDIQAGTGVFKVSKTGAVATGAITTTGAISATTTVTATGGLVLQNGAIVANGTDSEVSFTDTSEDIILDLDAAANTVGLKSSTGTIALAMGAVDDLTGVGTIEFDAAASTITLPSDEGADDLTIQVTGANDASLKLASSGTGADAISAITSAGGIDLTVAGAAAGEDLDLSASTSVNITGAEAAGDAIVLSASNAAGGIDVGYGTGDLVVTGTGAGADFTLDTDLFSIDGTGTSNVTLTSTAGSEDFTVALAGAFDSSLILSSTGTAEDALQITTTAGGINITNGGAAAGEDTDIVATNASVNVQGGEAAADAIKLYASNAAGGITVNYGTGNLIITGTGVSADLTADCDLFSIDGTGTSNLSITGAAGEDLTISQLGAADASLFLSSTGTAEDALGISTSAGGINITVAGAAAGEDLDLSSSTSVNITGAEAAADAIALSASNAAGGITVGFGTGNMVVTGTGVSADFTLDCDLLSIDSTGTSNIGITGGAGEDLTIAQLGAADASLFLSSTGTAADALGISTSAGGIDITNGGAAGGEDLDISSTTASVNISAGEDVEEAIVISATTGGINITADGASAKDLDLVCTNGSTNLSGGEDIATAVVISAGAGGIDISATGEAGQDVDILNTGGSVTVTATEDIGDAIYLHENAGTAGGIKLHADQGAAADSIYLLSDVGGITLAAGSGDTVYLASPITTNDGVGAKAGANVAATEYGNRAMHQTLLTFTAQTISTVSAADHPGIATMKIYDFPDGLIHLYGLTADIVITGSDIFDATWEGDFALGTATNTGDTFAGTEVDMLASTAIAAATAKVADIEGVSTATQQVNFNGIGAANDLYLNIIVDDTDINDGTENALMTGTITITWTNLGTY